MALPREVLPARRRGALLQRSGRSLTATVAIACSLHVIAAAEPAVLARVDAAVPRRARLKARWSLSAAPERSRDPARGTERSRREWHRRGAGGPALEKTLGKQARVLELMRRGYTEHRERTYVWGEGGVHIEELSRDGLEGPWIRMGLYFVDGASYSLFRSGHTAQVWNGSNVLAGSLAEAVFCYGRRLTEILDSASVRESRRGDRVVLSGNLLWLTRVGNPYTRGSTLTLETEPASGALPLALEVRLRGELRERATAERLRRYGQVLYPSVIRVQHFAHGSVLRTWTIEVPDLEEGERVRQADLAPSDPSPLRVSDARLGFDRQVAYNLAAGEPFPSRQALAATPEKGGAPSPSRPRSDSILAIGRFAGLAVIVLGAGSILLRQRLLRRAAIPGQPVEAHAATAAPPSRETCEQ